MTDKKNPDQKNIPVDFDDDDDIIELTNEVIIKPKKDDKPGDLQDTGQDVPKPLVDALGETDEMEPEFDDEDDIFNMDHGPELGSETEGTILDLDEAFAEDEPPIDEDDIIASAIAESLGPDDEEPTEEMIKLSDEPDTVSETEDDVIIMKDDDGEPAGASDGAAGPAEREAEVFDTEEEIELEYETNEDEYDFFAMDDEKPFEELDTITMADSKPDDTANDDMPFDPLSGLNLNADEDDEIIAMEADSLAEPDLMAFDDEETLEFEGDDDIPDVTDEMEFEEADDLSDLTDEANFEGADDLPDLTDEVEFEETDDLPDLTDEAEPEGADELPDLADEAEFEGADELPDLTDEAESEGADELPDLTDEAEFEFDDDEEENDLTAANDQVADDSDDIIARTIEESMAPDEVSSRIDLAMGPGFELTEDGDMALETGEPADEIDFTDDREDEIDFTGEQAEEEDYAARTKEELRALAEADDLPDAADDDDLEFEDEDDVPDMEEDDDLESEIEDLAIEEMEDSRADEDDDVIEITEFDEHFPEEDEKKLERAGVLDASPSEEEDFLELIEIEDEDSAEDEEIIEFNNSEDQIDEDEIDNFFSESSEDEPVFEDDEMAPVNGTPALSTDMAMATAATAAEDAVEDEDEDEEFEFSFDSSEISQQVDRLDTFLADDSIPEPAVATLPDETFVEDEIEAADLPAEKETLDDDQPAAEDTDVSLPVSPEQIDAILERVIKDKFGGKIENVIYDVIEKAVSKEIDRLKGALLDSGEGDHGDIE
jgi:hypothetical protein